MRKKTLSIILLVAIIVVIGVIAWWIRQPEKLQLSTSTLLSDNEQTDITYYFGQECSHCQAVDEFITNNQIDQKVVFNKKEVWHNNANNSELQEKAKECSLDPDRVGVPFLFARGKCFIGDVDVEDFLKKESGVQ